MCSSQGEAAVKAHSPSRTFSHRNYRAKFLSQALPHPVDLPFHSLTHSRLDSLRAAVPMAGYVGTGGDDDVVSRVPPVLLAVLIGKTVELDCSQGSFALTKGLQSATPAGDPKSPTAGFGSYAALLRSEDSR